MFKSKKSTTTLAAFTLVGSLGAAGLLLYGPPQAEAASSSGSENAQSSPSSYTTRTAISKLEENRAALVAQQDAERTEAARAFKLPPATEFGPLEAFDGIETQIAAYRASSDAKSSGASSVESPTTYWYEDGFFASLAAIDWKCAWLSTGVKQVNADDLDGVAETVKVLHSFTSTEYASAFPDYDYFLEESVDPLLKGDTSGAYLYLPNCVDSTRVD
ncbi:hypothetical protein [Georgenia yuyongxinii]